MVLSALLGKTSIHIFDLLDYTCRARWPEGLLCSTISLKSCNLAQILQSPKSEFVTCVMFSTHTNTSLIKPHLTELDEIHRNRPKSNYNLAKNLQSWSVTSDPRTDGQTEIHTFFIWHPCVGREHNSPSGKKFLKFLDRLGKCNPDMKICVVQKESEI